MPKQKPPYDPRKMAEAIAYAKDHAFDKKVVKDRRFTGRDNEKYGKDLKIGSRDDFCQHIEKSLLDKNTKVYQALDNRDFYYNESTNTIVIVSIDAPERGTCYRDKRHEKEFERIVESDARISAVLDYEQGIVQEGGYHGLYDEQTISAEHSQNQQTSQPTQEGSSFEVSESEGLPTLGYDLTRRRSLRDGDV